ncbi:MAG: methyltransferase domain-containing protein [Eudoraea sp.]|nr:methyltransferase domain-containing protein [Eudoraea sp.]
MSEEKAYILGTDKEELYRLGLQHQVWAEEAQIGWRLAGFGAGQTLLDLGCGPGYCTQELAFIAGMEGKVIGIDKSENYIHHLQHLINYRGLSGEAIHVDFDHMSLADNSLDGMYCRWALAWLPNPVEILQKVYKALKPGGRIVIHEYYDWSTLQTEPDMPALMTGIRATLRSFKESEGEIDIGRELPAELSKMGMKIISTRPMSKIATPRNVTWQWPKSFFYSYFPRLISMGYLSANEVENALAEMEALENIEGASICTPLMFEVIAEK